MRTQRRRADNTTTFLFNWMPQQLSFIVLTLSLVFFLNYLFVIQSIFIQPNIRRVIRIRCKVPAVPVVGGIASCTTKSASLQLLSPPLSSKLCQLAIDVNGDVYESGSKSKSDDDDNNMMNDSGKAITITTPLAHVSRLIKCSLNSRTTIATASVKLIDKAMPTQLIPLQRPIVTTNLNNILNNTNTILNDYNYYSKATFVHRHPNRSSSVYSGNMANIVSIIPNEHTHLNGTTNLTNGSAFVEVFIALDTANSDHNKLNNISSKFSLENDICIRYSSMECGGNMLQQQQHRQQEQHKHYCDNSDCKSCSTAAAAATAQVRCYR